MTESRGTNKQRIICLLDILMKNTDESNGLTMTEIFDELYLRNITAERKAIYNDIEILRASGFNVEKRHGNTVTYHLVSNLFTAKNISDIALLISTSPFVSREKAKKLALAMGEQTTKETKAATTLEQLRTFTYEREDRTEIISALLKASAEKKKVLLATDAETVKVSVYAVCFVENVPYAVFGSLAREKKIDHIKITNIIAVEQTDIMATPVETCADDESFDMNNYIDSNINIKPTKKYLVDVTVDESLIISFIEAFIGDKLEGDAKTSRVDDYRFRVNMKTHISKELIRFLYVHSDGITVTAPECLKEKLSRIDDYISI